MEMFFYKSKDYKITICILILIKSGAEKSKFLRKNLAATALAVLLHDHFIK